MNIKIVESLHEVDKDAWSNLVGSNDPFLQYDFLHGLEKHNCLQPYGWIPQHITVYENKQLVAAMPLYIKDNTYGEFVFDHAWANAYHQYGINYFPKLVSSIPYTPATGARLLILNSKDEATYQKILVDTAIALAEEIKCSSIHWLFTDNRDNKFFHQLNMPMRLGCQFQWRNNNYESFDHFLSFMTAQKRKKIKRERRRVKEQGINISILNGHDMTESLWHTYHQFYCNTFDRKSGEPTLSLEFFQSLGENMPENLAVVFARHNNNYVACAFTIKGNTTLYGRHWGCLANYHSLHFEACYYQGIEYCIENGLQSFEPGAQGEHKISRGFLPTQTWSAHWLPEPKDGQPDFKQAITQFCKDEQRGMQHYIDSLKDHSPFKDDVENNSKDGRQNG